MNTKKTMISIFLLLATMLIFVANCGDDDVTGPDESLLLGTWAPTSATVNGEYRALSEYFDWSQGAVRAEITLNANSTFSNNKFDVSDIAVYTSAGTYTVSGSNLTLTTTTEDGTTITPKVMALGWSVSGNTMTITETRDGWTGVTIWTKVII